MNAHYLAVIVSFYLHDIDGGLGSYYTSLGVPLRYQFVNRYNLIVAQGN